MRLTFLFFYYDTMLWWVLFAIILEKLAASMFKLKKLIANLTFVFMATDHKAVNPIFWLTKTLLLEPKDWTLLTQWTWSSAKSHPPPIITAHFPNIYLNTILSSPSQSYKWPFSKRFSHKNSVCIPCLSHPSYIPNLLVTQRFHYPNNTR
jgi:hypothetical protein